MRVLRQSHQPRGRGHFDPSHHAALDLCRALLFGTVRGNRVEDAVTNEPEWNAHVTCAFCHGLKAKSDTVEVDGKTLCKGGCLDTHLGKPMPARLRGSYWSESG